MNLLALETATDCCSVALRVGDEVIEDHRLAPRQHAALILPMIDGVLAAAGMTRHALDAIAFGRGPGAFTGLRIAAGVAQGLALGLDRPVVPVSTLAALAQASGAGRVLAAFDARLGEVYYGYYTRGADGLVEADVDDALAPPEHVVLPADPAWRGLGVGAGWAAHGEALRARLGARIEAVDVTAEPRAGALARLAARAFERGQAVPPELALPVYLRDRVTHGS
ncbi:tRNA (adenosine(37)-N6)-threonylcarbamoyltransferase complex dimerization subunit type 1 TsaB [Immundisolibacter sp.]|uniref:tRNA (adenosine(37)-N6)-threonylcarbamoyltransferase complex dimerization subunit type 1 TsaB n=1 Tax=Immundisolibacter sp. TaxID=1934948 RepID=UPI002607C180|nr:tRNA (adenosine(37)-N6)-threonylcarbamoyltransferase complex dimerization subunit type 1 TsaB [Immundisolibacter sp.]MDD3650977.1 tRNA (adenosine(37)-N6)-threonylcarbamoyltransferase complex dimerization subunit type 1 TsaB [Immundisolibacter sp.]